MPPGHTVWLPRDAGAECGKEGVPIFLGQFDDGKYDGFAGCAKMQRCCREKRNRPGAS